MPYTGDVEKINVTSSIFADFIENGCLYVDKTVFVEHIIQDASNVLLFTRPRRMGKSLNLSTLYAFLDCKQDNRRLFEGLYIEKSPVFNEINMHPVIYFNFKDFTSENIRELLRRNLTKQIKKYLAPEQLGEVLARYLENEEDRDPAAIKEFMEVLFEVYGKKAYLLIDEYDKPIFENMANPGFEDLKQYIVNALSIAMKDNQYLKKAVLTGVTRITNESLFSAFNNPEIYDIFRPSEYDADFSLTEGEIAELLDAPEADTIRPWYNNIRVGGEKLFNIYSVMSYLKQRVLDTHWSRTGASNLLGQLMTGRQRETIAKMLSTGSSHITPVDKHISLSALRFPCPDEAYYSLAIQTGYLTFEMIQPGQEPLCHVSIPNQEAWHIWRSMILYAGNGNGKRSIDSELREIFQNISDTESFDRGLEKIITDYLL